MNARVYIRNIKLHDSRRCLTERSDNLPYTNTYIQIKHENRKRNGFQKKSALHIIGESRRHDQRQVLL